MRKQILILLFFLTSVLCFNGCKKNSTFSIQFIDVGQGDSALVECDGHYMLIDGGPKQAGSKVYDVLDKNNVKELDILAISHLHDDHIGGLAKAITRLHNINYVISNADQDKKNKESFKNLEHQLVGINGINITVPDKGEEYELGSAKVKVLYNCAEEENDGLVLLITYRKTSFLFTGDIEAKGQDQLEKDYGNGKEKLSKITLMKIPHHGGELHYEFLNTFLPDYVLISVGKGNIYGHPYQETLELFDNKTYKPKVYRTDKNGDIIVRSDGKNIDVITER